jgi:AcrR family transcriptional regulator
MAKRSSKASSAKASGAKASGAKATGAKSARASGDAAQSAIEAALSLAAEKGWRDLALADIAEAAGLSIGQLYAIYPSKTDILAAYSRNIDAAVLAETEAPGEEESAKDRLFDLLMRRFDKLDAHKAGLVRIAEDTGRDPLALVCSLANLDRSMAAMLEAAGISTTGLRGVVRIKGLAAVYLAGMRAWFRDDSADKAKTMAALDKSLGRAERMASGFGNPQRRAAA